MTKLVVLTVPVSASLAAAQAQLIDAAGGPEPVDEEWVFPDGVHALAGDFALGAPGAILHLRGSDQVSLAITEGGLIVTGGTVRLTELAISAIEAARALSVTAPIIELSDVDVTAQGPEAVTAVALDAGDAGSIAIDDLEVIAVAAVAGNAIAVTAAGGTVRAARIEVGSVSSPGDAHAIQIAAAGDATVSELSVEYVAGGSLASAIAVSTLGDLDASKLTAVKVSGANALAILALASGVEARVVDIRVGAAIGTAGSAAGLIAVAAEDLTVRGLSIAGIEGNGEAVGLVAAGGSGAGPARDPEAPALQVGFGTIEDVESAVGTAAGARVLAGATRREVVVRDLAVIRVETSAVVAPVQPLAGPPPVAWSTWGEAALAARAGAAAPTFELPLLPMGGGTVGLQLAAVVDDVAAFADAVTAGDAIVADASIYHVHGPALAIEAGMRAAVVRRCEVWTAVQGGWLQGDRALLVNTTWHRLGAGLAIGPGEVRVYDSIFSDIAAAGDPVALDPDAIWGAGGAAFAPVESVRFEELGPVPYVDPGPPGLPAPWLAGATAPLDTADLALAEGSPLHARAVPPPPDELERTDPPAPFVGAHPPGASARCRLYDPLRPGDERAPAEPPPPPVADYRARDAASLLAVMDQRARTVMAPWTDRGPADLTTMVLETVAERLDHLAYQQERAVAEGFLEDTRLYRSLEDHVRPLDYALDRGLSATAMLRFSVDALALAAARAGGVLAADPVLEHLATDDVVEIPALTLVANATAGERLVVFATEDALTYAADLDAIAIARRAEAGATYAELALPASHALLAIGRWLVLAEPDAGGRVRRGHVVRITSRRVGTDVLEIGWDPRRPLPFPLVPGAAVALGNVVPAHHGLPLASIADAASLDPIRAGLVAALRQTVAPAPEISLAFHPISAWARGYPRPDEDARIGEPQLAVTVDGEPWRRVDDLSIPEAGDEVFAIRTSADGRTAIRFGDGLHGAGLPDEPVELGTAPVVGLGTAGNVGDGVLARILHLPEETTSSLALGKPFALDADTVRSFLRVTNPLPAVGGRDPEPLERARYRAPLALARPLSAVRPEDYARVAEALPEVAAATARVVDSALRPVVRVTVLLADEDTLDDAERLRRWAVVRKAIEDARLIGFDIETVPPRWVPLDLDVIVDAEPHANAGAVRDAVIATVAGDGGLLDPDTGRLGGDVHLADLYRAASRARGVAAVRVRRFRRLGRGMPELSDHLDAGVIRLGPEEVAVVRGPRAPAGAAQGPTADGVLTVTVCGGLS